MDSEGKWTAEHRGDRSSHSAFRVSLRTLSAAVPVRSHFSLFLLTTVIATINDSKSHDQEAAQRSRKTSRRFRPLNRSTRGFFSCQAILARRRRSGPVDYRWIDTVSDQLLLS